MATRHTDEFLPMISPAEHQSRVERLRAELRARELEAAVVYGDERAYENVRYLSGYLPIFEMAVLVITTADRPPLLLTGLEGTTSARLQTHGVEVEVYPPFTVQGMAFPEQPALADLLMEGGIAAGQRVGMIGPRYFPAGTPDRDRLHAVPHAVVAAAADLVGDDERVVNASEIMTHPTHGLRIRKSAAEILLLEEANRLATVGVEAMLAALRPGISELEVLGAAYSAAPAPAFAYWPVLHLGVERQRTGLDGPGSARAETGDSCMLYYPPTVAGYCANVGRVQVLAAGPDDLPAPRREIVERLFAPIYRGYAGLLATLGVGRSGDEIWRAATDPIRAAGLSPAYDPCSHIGLGEWENVFVFSGSTMEAASGMVVQADFTVPADDPALGVGQIEDGFALADQTLQEEIHSLDPQMQDRVQRRRAQLAERGVVVDESVLPLGDLAGIWRPYALTSSIELQAG